MNKKISIVIPVYNEENFILKCLDSVYSQDYPNNLMEIIVIDGESRDRTVELIKQYFGNVKVLNNPDRIVPISMNIGIKEAKGEYIVRLDAHCEYPQNYLKRLINRISQGDIDNVGGVLETLPYDDSNKSKAIATALSTRFGVGNSHFRVGTTKEIDVDTVPFGCFPKEVFIKYGLYDKELVRNQDDELNARILKGGGRIVLLSDVTIKYYSRNSIIKVAKMFFQYGLYKPLVNNKLKKVTSLRQLVPLLLMIGLILGAALSLFFSLFRMFYVTGLLLYVVLNLFASLNNSRTPMIFGYLFICYPVIHFSYGWGYLNGIFKILFNKPFNVNNNR